MIKFIQPTEVNEGNNVLPSEALLIDGEAIEDQIDGYQTLTVEGRELMGQELHVVDRVGSDGGILTQSRYPQRYITVKYKMEAEDRVQFRNNFNKLNRLLTGRDKELRFNDERYYYFIGTLESADPVPTGSNSVVSSFTFLCDDPFKYRDNTLTSPSPLVLNINTPYNTLPSRIVIKLSQGGGDTVKLMMGEKEIELRGVGGNSGDTFTFDFEEQLIYKNGTNVMRHLELTSDFEDFYMKSWNRITTEPQSLIQFYYKEAEL